MGDAKGADVSVLTPVFDEERNIRETVAAMQAQELDGSVEFLFIDGGSTDHTVAVLEELREQDTRIRLLHNPDRRPASALNIGLRHATGRFVARMDAHTTYPSGYLASGIRHLERSEVEWASGPALPVGRGRISELVALALQSRLGFGGAAFRRPVEQPTEVDAGFTGVWRRETLERQGGWDEDWLVNEDGELAARVRADGGRIVCAPDMAAGYVPRDSLRGLARQYWRYGQYRAKTSGRHPASMRRSHALPPALVGSAAAACLPGRLGRTARVGLAGYLAAAAIGSLGLSLRFRRLGAVGALLVFTVMHASWGAGFLTGCIRFGFPLHGLVRALHGRAR